MYNLQALFQEVFRGKSERYSQRNCLIG